MNITSICLKSCMSVLLIASFGCSTTSGSGNGKNKDNSLTFRNFVLERMESASMAMKTGRTGQAALELDQAISSIESVFGYDEAARKARSLWYEEGSKVFKGEPYERAMAFYYRGLIFLKTGDLENARACFKNGMMQDAFAEEQQNRCDFAILSLLQYWSSLKLADNESCNALKEELSILRPQLTLPDNRHNVIFVVETGTSPRKLADGVAQNKLVYRRGKNFSEDNASITLNNTHIELTPVESIFWQASSRGGRMVDAILEGKAMFRQKTAKAGEFLSNLGSSAVIWAPLSDASSVEITNIGAGLAVVGATVQLVALNAKPKADTRYWHGLPDMIHCGYQYLEPGDYTVAVNFADKNRVTLPTLSKTIHFTVEQNKPTVVWASAR